MSLRNNKKKIKNDYSWKFRNFSGNQINLSSTIKPKRDQIRIFRNFHKNRSYIHQVHNKTMSISLMFWVSNSREYVWFASWRNDIDFFSVYLNCLGLYQLQRKLVFLCQHFFFLTLLAQVITLNKVSWDEKTIKNRLLPHKQKAKLNPVF